VTPVIKATFFEAMRDKNLKLAGESRT
jgi:hypothetical protein